jgi:nitric oxide reductase subunit B
MPRRSDTAAIPTSPSLWVEGFFEVFATVVIAFLFGRLHLVSLRTAGSATVLAATIFLAGGIIGTLHHLYFSGTPTFALALGSVFSALEVVPFAVRQTGAMQTLRWMRVVGDTGSPSESQRWCGSSPA